MTDPIVKTAVKRHVDAETYERLTGAVTGLEDLSDDIEDGKVRIETGGEAWSAERLKGLNEDLGEAIFVIQSIFQCLCEDMDPDDTK